MTSKIWSENRQPARAVTAADFRTRVYLQLLQILYETGLPLDGFKVEAVKVDPPVGRSKVSARVTVQWVESGLARTYTSAKGQSWTLHFRNDLRAGKFTEETAPDTGARPR